LTVKLFSSPVFFDDHIGHFVATFVCGKTTLTIKALPAPADGVPFFAFPGIDYLVFAMATKRTDHFEPPDWILCKDVLHGTER
jgi:hypothetical protein